MGWGCQGCGGTNPDGTRFCGHCGVAAAAAGGGSDEQRVISALFADISGFTSLADRLGAEELHAVISPVISMLAGVAEDYGGTLAKYAGDAVLVFFGAPVAQEDHARRALACALDMHAALASAGPRLGADAAGLELHIGVNSGRVVAGMFGGDVRTDYSILGDAVNVAQRLESVAPAGATYVGATTVELAGGEFELAALGGLTVKGKADPVQAWSLSGRRVVGTPSAGRDCGLVGRERELAAVADVLAALPAGAVVSVTAEAGGGKSRLVEAIRELGERQGIRWLEARAISYGASLAYFPYVDLLRRSFGIRFELDPRLAARQLAAGLAELGVAPTAPYFARLLGLPAPEGSADISALEPEAFARELTDAFTALIAALAGRGPLALAFEDVHWADSASIELTERLMGLAARLPIVAVLTGRPEGRETIASLASSLPGQRRLDLDLAPLDRSATADILAGILGARAPDDVVEQVHGRSNGNPFFVGELARAMRDGGGAVAALPMTIEGVLSARIDMLPRSTASVLQIASVIGRRVDVSLLEAVAEDVADLPMALERLVEGGFFDRIPSGLRFHHALVVDAAYGRLVRRERRDLHRRVAESAEVIYGTGDDVIDLLARHLYLAEAGVKAVDYLEKAARRSASLYANDEAIVHLERALELAGATERVASRVPELTLELAQLEELIGRYADASALYRRVQAATNDTEAWRGLVSIARRGGELEEALHLLDDAFAHVRADADLGRLWLERASTFISLGSSLDAIAAADNGLAVVRNADEIVAGQLLLQQTKAELTLHRMDEALAHGIRALRVFEAHDDARNLAVALRVVGTIHSEAGDLDDASAVLHRGLELADRTGSIEEVVACLVNLGQVELRRGEVDAAIGFTERALEQAERIGHSMARMLAHTNLGEMHLVRGDLETALASCARGMELASETGSAWNLADGQRTMARICLALDRPAEAAEWAEKAAAGFVELADVGDAATSLEVAASAANAAGDAIRARSLAERARTLSDG